MTSFDLARYNCLFCNFVVSLNNLRITNLCCFFSRLLYIWCWLIWKLCTQTNLFIDSLTTIRKTWVFHSKHVLRGFIILIAWSFLVLLIKIIISALFLFQSTWNNLLLSKDRIINVWILIFLRRRFNQQMSIRTTICQQIIFIVLEICGKLELSLSYWSCFWNQSWIT